MVRQTKFSVLFQGEKGERGPPSPVSDLSSLSFPFSSITLSHPLTLLLSHPITLLLSHPLTLFFAHSIISYNEDEFEKLPADVTAYSFR